MSKGNTHRIQLRTVVAFPAVCVALVISVALVLTPFGPAQGMTLAALPTPTDTSTVTAVPTEISLPTVAPIDTSTTTAALAETLATTAAPTTAAPTTAAPTTAAPTTAPVPSPTPGQAPTLAPGPVDHHVLAWIGETDFKVNYLAQDAHVTDASQFQTFRVRFQLHNDGTAPITATPQLEYRPDGGAFAVVPETPQPGSPLHLAREWVLSENGGTKQGPLEESIPAAGFTMPAPVVKAVDGHHSMGANPVAPITLAPASYTEQEFTVALSMDAKYLTGYELRVTDGGTAQAGALVARIELGPPPALQLSAGQRQGVKVIDPTAPNATGVVYPLLAAPTTPAAPVPVATITAGDPGSVALYPLASGPLFPVPVLIINPATDPSTDSHDIGTAQCGACHRGHTAKAPDLTKNSQQSTLCFGCHGSTGPGKDVKGQYALTRPSNDADARDYYSHDAVDTSTSGKHTLDVNEFEGVSNRHSECADCHNSHKVGTTDSTEMGDGTGWNTSGRLAGVTGVAVTNGPTADSTPTYKLLDGVTEPVTREYELCFKCHSGYTKLLPPVAEKPSKDALDKGVEFNPANPSFHPIEAKGTNDTAKMTDSLAGSSPYKRWDFNIGSTIRCLNCHAGGAPEPAAAAALPQPGSSLAPHTSSNRGILLENYQDRVLKSGADSATFDADYSAGDFALCYVCHAEAPFANKSDPPAGTSNATNFKLHGLHLTDIKGKGNGGTDIDTAGDGQGNAICAECHFRIHSTTNKVGTQDITGSRLVNFAPNVLPEIAGGTLSWRANTAGGGSCTLTCHTHKHTGVGY